MKLISHTYVVSILSVSYCNKKWVTSEWINCKRVELLALDHNVVLVAHPELTMDSKFDSKFVGLETRIEHVASATFSNFR
jgi:hypothetical protein